MQLQPKHLYIIGAILAAGGIGAGVFYLVSEKQGCDATALQNQLFDTRQEQTDLYEEVFQGAVGICFPNLSDIDIGRRQSKSWCNKVGQGKQLGGLTVFVPGCLNYYDSPDVRESCREAVLLDPESERLEDEYAACIAEEGD